MTSVYIDGIGILSPSVRSNEDLVAAAARLLQGEKSVKF